MARFSLPDGSHEDPAECDRQTAEAAKLVYQRNGCWTWSDDWVWPTSEVIVSAPQPLEGGDSIDQHEGMAWLPDPKTIF